MIKNQILYNYYCIIDFFFVILHTISLRSNKMKNQKMYEPDDKMIYLIRDNYDLLQSLGCFGISLGFGDKTVREVCDDQNVDTYTFLAVVNFTINGYKAFDDVDRLSIPTLMQYLRASHTYYLEYKLPFIRKELCASLDETDNLARLILRLYDEYAHSIHNHMQYEEKNVFPYVDSLLNGEANDTYDVETYSKHHSQTDVKLRELKSIIIKYLPSDTHHNNRLTATLYDIYNCEAWLEQHALVEEEIFIQVISRLVQNIKQNQVSVKISTNTVITHRRNIARKLQIHSPAGLTIYAIVNNLVDISSVKL